MPHFLAPFADDKICDLYEAAMPIVESTAPPANAEKAAVDRWTQNYQELLSHLFMANVRLDRFNGQAAVATKLYKVRLLIV